MARIARRLAQTGVLLLVALVLAELALRAGSLLVRDRATPPRPNAAHVVLCAGDSHTYGAGVPVAESYPAQLQTFLDAFAPGRYSVVNVGVPGVSTTQVLHRLPSHLRSLRPDAVVLWCGINDAWNTSELEDTSIGLGRTVRDAVRGTRLYRLWRVWRHNERLFRDAAWDRAGDVPRPRIASDSDMNPNRTLTIDWGGNLERVQFTGVEEATLDPETEARVERNYETMVALARGTDARVVLVTYPFERAAFGSANRAMRRAATRAGTRVVESSRALGRVPRERQRWVLNLHPTAPIYREIARDVARAVIRSERQRSASGDTG